MSADRFEEALSLWENGQATPDGAGELESLLRESPSCRRAFVERMLLEVELYEAFSGETLEPRKPPAGETPVDRPPRGERPVERKRQGETPEGPMQRPREEKK
jgi:hypothetical protein